MRARTDDASPAEGREEGWDEAVLVWNATVARVPAPAAVEGDDAEPESPGSAASFR
jgi:hypothetical protein